MAEQAFEPADSNGSILSTLFDSSLFPSAPAEPDALPIWSASRQQGRAVAPSPGVLHPRAEGRRQQHEHFVPYFDVPIRGDDFFYYTPQDRWLELTRPGPATIFTGHFRLDHPLLRRMWMPYAAVSLLWNPVDRLLSAYNFTLRREGTLWHSEVTAGTMSFTDYAAAFTAGVGTQYGYFDDTGTGAASPQECLENLLNKVTFYGFST